VNDLLSKSIKRVKKKIIPALVTKLLIILATEERIVEKEKYERISSVRILVSILYLSQ
jgi:hypothetical protein